MAKYCRRTNLSGIKTVTLFIGLLSIVSVSNAGVLSIIDRRSKPKNVTCEEPECFKAAKKILQNLNTKVDPCDNFYEFACGNVAKGNQNPNHESDFFKAKDTKITLHLTNILKSSDDVLNGVNISIAKQTYKLCKDMSNSEHNLLHRIFELLEPLDVLSMFNLGSKINKNFNWMEVTKKLLNIGFSPTYFLDVHLRRHPRRKNQNIIEIEQPALNFEVLTQFAQVILNHLSDENKVDARSQILEIYEFYGRIINKDYSGNKERMKIKNFLQDFESSFPIKEYIESLLPEGMKVSMTDEIIIDCNFTSHFVKLIKETPKRVQADYLLWRLILESTSYVSKTFQQNPSEPDYCTEIVRTNFWNFELAYSYINKDDRKYVRELVENVMNSFIITMHKNKWMDRKSKLEAAKKLKFIVNYVGYPELFINLLENGLPSVKEVNEKNYLEVILKMKKAQQNAVFSSLKNYIPGSQWELEIIHPSDANAIYHILTNSIYIPTGILHSIIFNKNLPSYINYGGIGYLIAHEMSHAFDIKALNYDELGNPNPLDWSNKTIEELYEKLSCIENQFTNYSIMNMMIDSRRTIGEDFADISGLTEAYKTYSEWNRQNSNDPLLPGLPYNAKQMFWLSAANIWCTEETEEYVKSTVLFDDHSLPRIRVLKTFSNIPAFAEDFHCPVGSKMNPEDKCEIWR